MKKFLQFVFVDNLISQRCTLVGMPKLKIWNCASLLKCHPFGQFLDFEIEKSKNLTLCKPLKMSPIWPIVGLWNWKESTFSFWLIGMTEFSNGIIDFRFRSLWNCNEISVVHGVGIWHSLRYFQTVQTESKSYGWVILFDLRKMRHQDLYVFDLWAACKDLTLVI